MPSPLLRTPPPRHPPPGALSPLEAAGRTSTESAAATAVAHSASGRASASATLVTVRGAMAGEGVRGGEGGGARSGKGREGKEKKRQKRGVVVVEVAPGVVGVGEKVGTKGRGCHFPMGRLPTEGQQGGSIPWAIVCDGLSPESGAPVRCQRQGCDDKSGPEQRSTSNAFWIDSSPPGHGPSVLAATIISEATTRDDNLTVSSGSQSPSA